jgi:hypothetical protein
MEMNASARPESLRPTDHVQERRGHQSADSVLSEHCPNGQTPPRNPVGIPVSDEVTLETFIDGAGI